MEKETKIIPPEGYEIDKENSTLECIKFKPIEYNLIRRSAFATKGPSAKELQETMKKARSCTPLKEGTFEEGDIVVNPDYNNIYVFKEVIPKPSILSHADFKYYIEASNVNGSGNYYIDFNGKDFSFGDLRLATKKERLQFFKILSHLSNPRINSFRINM